MQSFPAHCRIKKRSEILEIQELGNKHFARHFLTIVSPSERAVSRLAVTVSKRVNRKAVKRNLVKRRVREIFRLNRYRLKGNFDILVIARKNAFEISFSETKREILGALHYNGYLS